MKKIKLGNKAGILLVTALLLLSTSVVLADTKDSKLVFDGHNQIEPLEETDINRGEEVIKYHNDYVYTGIGASVDMIQAAIRITPEELEPYNDEWVIVGANVYYYETQVMPTTLVYIHEEGTQYAPGDVIAQKKFKGLINGQGWYRLQLDAEDWIAVDNTTEYWVSWLIYVDPGMSYPVGADNGPAVDGKGDWIRLKQAEGEWQSWMELQDNDPPLDYNILMEAIVYSGGPLEANASGPYEGFVDQEIEFEGSATGGTLEYSFHWDFGDGNTSEEQNPTHIYAAEGEYIVNLTVDDGASIAYDETTATVIVDTSTHLAITDIVGGLGIIATITNDGDFSAESLEWHILVEGGLLGMVDADINGTEDTLESGASIEASTGLSGLGFLHLGPIDIKVTAKADNSIIAIDTIEGFIVGPFVLISTEE